MLPIVEMSLLAFLTGLSEWRWVPVTNLDSQVDLTRKLHMVEQDKIELAQSAIEVLRSIQSGNQKELTESLAAVVGLAYLLGIQMGIPPRQVDAAIDETLRRDLQHDDVREAAFRDVVRHLSDDHL